VVSVTHHLTSGIYALAKIFTTASIFSPEYKPPPSKYYLHNIFLRGQHKKMMNEITDMWQLFTLTGDPKQYLKYKERKGEASHPRKKENLRETNQS